MRIDRLLYFLRLSKSRSAAQRWIAEGHIRRNGERVLRLDQPVTVGDVLTLPVNEGVMVIELLALPERRGPAPEAKACYRSLDGNTRLDLAGPDAPQARGKAQQ
ncbi:MAG TPA: S4 domain-containing protein [Croceibacterium sp.]|nr:S4 domain-containing protein [Croceibacterium sp.]